MSKSKRNIRTAGTASILSIFAMSGTAFAGDPTDETYDDRTSTTYETESGMDHLKAMDAERKDEALKIASAFGVSELNDIEDWKIFNSGQEIGEIDRIGIDATTGELLAVVGLEGVLGVNMKEVGVPLSKLQLSGDETLSTELTKEELQQKRDIDPWDGTYSQLLDNETAQ